MSSLVRNKKWGATRPSALDGLKSSHRKFVLELLASDTFSPVEAARACGYKNPAKYAFTLLKKPAIAKALGKAQREREERCQLKGDDVLEYLRAALFFNPLQYFSPGMDGGWLIRDPASIPEHVGRLIDGMEIKHVEGEEGERTIYFKVQLVSKATVLGYALKHLGLLNEKQEITHRMSYDWERLYGKGSDGEVPDEIGQIIEAEGRVHDE